MEPLKVLLASVTLAGRTGTETAARDHALWLRAAGHRPMVYAPVLGELAAELTAAAIPVVSDLAAVPQPPDIVHGNQHVQLVSALLRFREARGLFVCHDRTSYWSAPPIMSRIRSYVCVDLNCRERLVNDYAIPQDRIRLVLNTVDTSRFRPRAPLPDAPAQAAIFSNYAGPGTHVEAVAEACVRVGLPVDVIGDAAGRSCSTPESVLGRYDVVFAKARCALEAMAIGCAVVLCDAQGLGPMVTPANVEELRRWNFGWRLLRQRLDPDAIAAQLRGYDAAAALAVSRYVREHASTAVGGPEYVDLYRAMMDEPPPRTTIEEDLDEYVRGSAGRVQSLSEALAALQEPVRMAPLSDAAAAMVSLRTIAAPAAISAGTPFRITIEAVNGSAHRLGSFPHFPVQLAYRWLDADTGEPAAGEPPRTPLTPPLEPGSAQQYEVRVLPPAAAGRYRLRVTLVQEWVLWFDAIDCPVFADVDLSVR